MDARAPREVQGHGRRLTLGFGSVMGGLFGLLLLIVWFHLEGIVEENENLLLESLAQTTSLSVQQVSHAGRHHSQNLLDVLLDENPALAYVVIQELDGGAYAAATRPDVNRLSAFVLSEPALKAAANDESVVRELFIDGQHFREAAVPLRRGFLKRIEGVIRVGVATDPLRKELASARWVFGFLALGVVLFGFVLIHWMSRRLAAPVERLASEFAGLLQHAPAWILILDQEGRVVRASDLFGQQQSGSVDGVSGLRLQDVLRDSDLEDLHQNLARVRDGDLEVVQGELKAGLSGEKEDEARCFLYSMFSLRGGRDGAQERVGLVALDVTRERALQRVLVDSRRMESIGQFAGGVAHDFNNLLTAILGLAELIQRRREKPASVDAMAGQIVDTVARAKELTGRLLSFGRRQVTLPVAHDLSELVLGLEQLLRRLLRADVALEVVVHDGPLPVRVDRGQVEQALLNLVANARDAMPEGGRIIVQTRSETFEETTVVGGVEVEVGRYAVIEVTDTGVGIPEDLHHHLFEPFVTTKEVGQGTGLGLSVVYGVMTKHQGHVGFVSTSEGTRFLLFFPFHHAKGGEGADDPGPGGEEAAGAREEAGLRGQRVLVVDDDPAVRGSVTEMVADRGGFPLQAADGDEAVRTLKAPREPIDLVLLDVIMPQMNGGEVYRQVRRFAPELPIVFMTGYDDAVLEALAKELGHALPYLMKPFSSEELEQCVKAAQAASRRPAPNGH